MAPTIGRQALDNGFHGSVPGDLVAPPPQTIHWQIPFFQLPYRDYQNHIQENDTFHSLTTDTLLSHRRHYKISPVNERVYPLFSIVYMPDTGGPMSRFSSS